MDGCEPLGRPLKSQRANPVKVWVDTVCRSKLITFVMQKNAPYSYCNWIM